MISDEMFWLLAAAMYAFDHVKLISQREMTIQETSLGGLAATLNAIPFTLGGRCVVLLNPFVPYACYFKFPWLCSTATGPDSLQTAYAHLRAFRGQVFGLRIIASISFASFFVVGSVLTLRLGLGQTLLLLAPLHIALICALGFELHARKLHLSRGQARLLILECLICPMYLPAVVKRLAWRECWTVDGIYFASAFNLMGPDLHESLRFRLTEISETCQHELSEIEAYRAKVSP